MKNRMKTKIAIAMFLAVGADSVGAAAQLNLKGSDKLKDMTIAMLNDTTAACGGVGNTPPGTLAYAATGDSNGQAAMVVGQQAVAPMGRPLDASICDSCGTATPVGLAHGVVFGLDAMAVVGDQTNWGACNGASSLSCSPTTPSEGGLAYNDKIIQAPETTGVSCTA